MIARRKNELRTTHCAIPVDDKEAGFIMIAMVTVLLPLTLIVAAFMSGMTGRTLRLREEFVQEKALLDLATLVAQAKNAASIVLTNSLYDAFDFGDASAGTAYITYREGDVKFTGNSRGAGLLVVTGNLEMVGTFRFDGIVVVLGDIDNSSGTAEIYGGLVQGPAATQLKFTGTSDVYFSTQALDIANTLTSRYVAFNGWQELSRK